MLSNMENLEVLEIAETSTMEINTVISGLCFERIKLQFEEENALHFMFKEPNPHKQFFSDIIY